MQSTCVFSHAHNQIDQPAEEHYNFYKKLWESYMIV